jgi:hypothetical protein
MTVNTPQLEYAAAPSKKRRWTRRIVLILLVIVATPLLIYWGRSAIAVLHARRLLHACGQYSPPAMPVYTEDPAEQAQFKNTYTALFNRVRYAYYTPQEWKDFNAATGGTQINGWGTLFLHELRTPSGTRRLVGVDFTGSSRGWIAGQPLPIHIVLAARVYDWPWAMAMPKVRTVWSGGMELPHREGVLRVLPGQIDPADPSHFTIPYTVDGQAGTIDGWLKDDDKILLEPRRTP